MADYVPVRDGEFDAWLWQFNDYFQADHVALGFQASDAAEVQSLLDAWRTVYAGSNAAKQAATAMAAEKKNTRREVERAIRRFVRVIQARPATSDLQRGNLGVTIPDRTRTLSPTPTVSPSIELDWSRRGQCVIHVGVNPQNESVNRFSPHGKMCLLQFRMQGGDWEHLAVATSSPFVHVVGNEEPWSIQYRAAYLNSRGRQGPWSDADTAYIAGAA